MDVTGNYDELLAERFEAQRSHLRSMAYRILGSPDEAEDAVQEAWLRLCRSDPDRLDNLRAWLTTVVARVCLDMLRARRARREDPLEENVSEQFVGRDTHAHPESEMLMADSMGLALLVILDTLAPAERIAFVLHDMFDMPFDEIAPIVGRSATATRQLASRARRRVQGADTGRSSDLPRQREVVEAFLAATRRGDFEALLAVLDPNVVIRADHAAAPGGQPLEVHGAAAVARDAFAASRRARFAQLALVDGAVGIVVAPYGRLFLVMTFTIAHGKIVEMEVIGDPERLRQLDLAILKD